MNPHPYVRGYMAGIVVPTLFLLVVMSAYFVLRFILQVPVPIERVIVFPMAGVPNLWGLWNMLYVRRRQGGHPSIGVHGALLPLVLAPLAFLVATGLGLAARSQGAFVYLEVIHANYGLVAIVIGVGIAIYYLAWKYFVNFFNELLGVA
ncbi:MAG TPA: hypothetical protein VLY23_02105 [Candidatus Acidoferrum sp.]|nr:hypothetical protein [Candidatus Acidoferrum sp.]